MFGKMKDMRDNMKMLKELQSKLGNVDMSNPQAMLDSMGIDINEIENQFNQSVEPLIERKVPVNYINDSENKNPEYAYDSDSGFDLRSTEDIWVQANDRKLVPTGLRFDIPDGYEIQVRSKSGLALNQGLMVLNSPGTVDQGYTGEIKVIIFNVNQHPVNIKKNQKIAQAVLTPVVSGKWINLIKVKDIEDKDRSDKGFGSTGL